MSNQKLFSNLSKKIFAFSAIITLLLLFTLPSIGLAAYPYPTIGTATVDGAYGEWDLTDDFFANMYRAGKDDAQHPVESKLYLRYDPPTETLYLLVLTEPGVLGLKLADDAWAAIDGISNKKVNGNSGNDGTPPDFAWVNPTNGNVDGFEASFKLAIGEYELIVHIQVFDDAEAQTSKTLRPNIELFIIPETIVATTLLATLAGGGVFYFIKKRQNSPQINNI
jgi:hypothetical protein